MFSFNCIAKCYCIKSDNTTLQYTSIQSSLDVSSKELNLLGVNVGGGLATSLCDSGGDFGFSVVSF